MITCSRQGFRTHDLNDLLRKQWDERNNPIDSLHTSNDTTVVIMLTEMFVLFSSCSEFVWRSQLRNAWPWRSSLIAPRPEMRLEETLLQPWLMSVVCCFGLRHQFAFGLSACLLSVFINSCSLSSSFLVHIVVFRCWTVCLAASPCH